MAHGEGIEAFTQQMALAAGDPLTIPSLVLALGIGLILSFGLMWHFVKYAATLSNRRQFAATFPMIILTTTLIIAIVKSSLALSLGLVGALSIVRFRTPIKEPEELAYLFIAIAMGLGLGAAQYAPTVVAAVIILGALAWVRRKPRNQLSSNMYLCLTWDSANAALTNPLSAFHDVLHKHASGIDLRRYDLQKEAAEAVYYLLLETSEKLPRLIEELKSTFPGLGITFIDQNHMPTG